MKYDIRATKSFDKEVKAIAKKQSSLKSDLKELQAELLKNPRMGDEVTKDVYKIRMAITSSNKGKSGGARIITYLLEESPDAPPEEGITKIYLLSIYTKSDKEDIENHEIENLKKSVFDE
jgi:mRNA-degrading endonuclease RelE of RelBE toxin-antitoxin system